MTSGQMQDKTFVFPIRVYYEDTDAGEIVYYANYLKFAERARTEFLRHFEINQSVLLDELKLAFAVKHVQADYKRPAKLDDLLTVHTRLINLKGASLEMAQEIRRGEEVLVLLKVRVACIHLEGRPMAIPKEIRNILANMLEA